MKELCWDKNAFYINGKPEFLISGEFHYFRVPKAEWRQRLELLQEAEGNCVATYIPWILHEPEEGDIRFGDIPERDLEEFLLLCSQLDLFVICRPGPYQYSEMRYDGLPGWLCENYPEIHAQDVNGKSFRSASVSYLHPTFLEKVKKWYDAVCPIIAKYTVSKGGPVQFVQYDNEVMGIHLWFSGLDYNKEAMGIGMKGGRYPIYLQKKYKTVASLNSFYNSHFRDFSEVTPIITTKSVAERRSAKDYQEFYFDSVASYGEILIKWMRELGIDCDIVHNSPSPATNSSFLEAVKLLGRGFLLGTDHYYNLSPEWEQNHPTPQHVRKVFYSNEMLRLMGFPATVLELPAGSAVDWPPILREDINCYYYANLAFGMKGFNYYIFTGGSNPEGIGQFGDIYDYGAGVGADGSIRSIYEVQKEFGRFLKENAWLAKAQRECDFYIGLDWEHSRSERYFEQKGEFEFSSEQAWDFMCKGIMTSALNASSSPNLLDLYSEEQLKYCDKPLVISTSVNMSKAVQESLIKYIINGGQILIAPVIPYLDENFVSCTLLKDFLGGAGVIKFSGNFPRINIGPVENVFLNGELFSSTNRPKDAKQIASDQYSGLELGWQKTFEGGGRVIWLGMQWVNSMDTHRCMFKYLLNNLGVTNNIVESSNPNIWTSLRRYKSQGMLFAMNLFSSPIRTKVKVEVEGTIYMNETEFILQPMEVKTFYIDFTKKDT